MEKYPWVRVLFFLKRYKCISCHEGKLKIFRADSQYLRAKEEKPLILSITVRPSGVSLHPLLAYTIGQAS